MRLFEWSDKFRCKNKRQSQLRLATVTLYGLFQARTRLGRGQQSRHEGDLFFAGQVDDFVLLHDPRSGLLCTVVDKFTQGAARQAGGTLKEILLLAGYARLQARIARLIRSFWCIQHGVPPLLGLRRYSSILYAI